MSATTSAIPTDSSVKSWIVVLTAALLFFYTFIPMNVCNSISVKLMHDFAINTTQLGNLAAAYFYANFAMIFPAGLLLDRFSSRKLILFAMLLSVLGMLGFGLAPNVWWAGFSRVLAGIGGSFAFLGSIRLASRWFPARQMGMATGCVVTLAMIGGMVAQTPVVLLINHLHNWRYAMLIIAAVGALMLIIMWFTVQDKAEEKIAAADANAIGFWRSIARVLTNRYNWLSGLYITFLNLPLFVLGGLWGDMYLTQIDHVTKVRASLVISMLFFGQIFGSPILGIISDKLKRRILPMLISAIIATATIATIMYMANLSFLVLILLFLLLGFIVSAQIIGYPVITELNSPALTGSALSIASLLIMASGFIFPPLYGFLMGLHWNHLTLHSVPIYSIHDFRLAMLTLFIPFIISIFLTLFIKETHAKSQVK